MGDCSDGDDDDNVEEEEEDDDDDNNHNNDDDNSDDDDDDDDDDDCEWGEGGDVEGDVCQIEEWLENPYFYSVFFN